MDNLLYKRLDTIEDVMPSGVDSRTLTPDQREAYYQELLRQRKRQDDLRTEEIREANRQIREEEHAQWLKERWTRIG